MPPLQDPVLLARYQSALANWGVTGYVLWKETALTWLRQHLGGMDPRLVAQLMFRHVAAGGVIDQVPERRPEWSDYDFHYDLRLPIAGRLIYVETVLLDDDPTDPILRVVSIHDA
jgi:hypothetical protein